MNDTLDTLYRHSLALLTDLYQLTMAAGYYQSRLAERQAVFHLIFRNCPFEGQYAVACGLTQAIEFVQRFRFSDDDVQYLAGLKGNDDSPLFKDEFLEYLRQLKFHCDVDALPEGTVTFPHEPLIRVRGPLLQCQLMETPLLTIVNFQTLIATKAARVCDAAGGDAVIEFGLRRAQGIDGGISAARAAYVGGCGATSNVLAGRLFDIPVKGTHAHSWVMAFDNELASFRAYADAMPNNSVFLADTYDTLQGVRNAVKVGQEMRRQGHEMVGIRLDSGDLTQLSIDARKILDEGGFPEATIVASSDLDEYSIAEMKQRKTKITVWGVGTRLATAYDQPALGGVYKLAAVEDESGTLRPRIKLSDSPVKVSDPGVLQVRRYQRDGMFIGDIVHDVTLGMEGTSYVSLDERRHGAIDVQAQAEDLLVPVFREGNLVYDIPAIHDAQRRTRQQLAALPAATRQLQNPREYPLGLATNLMKLKQRLMKEAEQKASSRETK